MTMTTKKGLFLSLKREAGLYILTIRRQGESRVETWESRDDAWSRIRRLRGVE